VKTCLNASKALHLKLESTSLASGAARFVAVKITHRTHRVGGLEDPRRGPGVVVNMKLSPSAENRSQWTTALSVTLMHAAACKSILINKWRMCIVLIFSYRSVTGDRTTAGLGLVKFEKTFS
jgi:hypothetical protein